MAQALAAHGPEQAETFVQEMIWRGCFNGWLERGPQVWDRYVHGCRPIWAQCSGTVTCAATWSA